MFSLCGAALGGYEEGSLVRPVPAGAVAEDPVSVHLLVPRYSHPSVSEDERMAKAIADVLDPGSPLPQKCGDCGSVSSFRNPLMMRPRFRMDHGGPKGTLYQARCSACMERRARER